MAKPIYGSLGRGVERIGPGEQARLHAILAQRGALYLQRFVAGATLDVRAFVVGKRVVAAMARAPQVGDFRGNVHVGAVAHEIVIDAATAELALSATQAVGLDYSGVDLLIGPHGPEVIEVNGTPSFRGIYDATGRDMAPAIVEHATRALRVRKAG